MKIEIVLATVNWCFALVLASLLVLVYRQYSLSLRPRSQTGSTLVGQSVPPLAVVSSHGAEQIAIEDDDRLRLFLFTNAGCKECHAVLRELSERPVEHIARTIVAQSAGTPPRDVVEAVKNAPWLPIYGVVSPADVISQWKITVVPVAVVAHGQTVVGVRKVARGSDVLALIAESHASLDRTSATLVSH